jgi:hypothetical protein
MCTKEAGCPHPRPWSLLFPKANSTAFFVLFIIRLLSQFLVFGPGFL